MVINLSDKKVSCIAVVAISKHRGPLREWMRVFWRCTVAVWLGIGWRRVKEESKILCVLP